jgi:(p)ppGpp synthase/HD superfamily hydrolase
VRRADGETRLVSASDKLHNVRTILADYRADGESIWSRFSGKKEGTLWYYRALSDEYQRRGRNRITRELAVAVTELERLVKKTRRSPEVESAIQVDNRQRARSTGR